MTDLEIRRARGIMTCNTLPGAFEKKLAKAVIDQAAIDVTKPLSDKQSFYLERACWKFRRQLPAELSPRTAPPTTPPWMRIKIGSKA